MKTTTHLFLALSLLAGGCAVETDDVDAVAQQLAAHPILLPESGTGQNREVMSSFDPLVVRLYDVDGAPVAGALVTFTAPAAGASSTFRFDGRVETDTTGRAELRPYANQWAGTYTVWAHVEGADPMPFALTNTAAPPAQILPILGTNQSGAMGRPFEYPLTIEVRDNYGNVVEGAPVQFVAPTDGPTTRVMENASTITNGEGLASTFAIAGDVPGTYTVLAKVPGAPAYAFVLSNFDPDDTSWRMRAAQKAATNAFEQAP